METQEKKLKEILISQREEYQQYLGVLAESLKGTQDDYFHRHCERAKRRAKQSHKIATAFGLAMTATLSD